MKRYIYIMMAMLAGAFASCSKEDTSQSPGTEGTQSVTINLVADDAVNTRAAAMGLSQYIIEVYSDAAYTTPENIFGEGATATNRATSANGSFSLILDRTREYHCLFWADKDAAAYTTATLKTVTPAPDKTPAEAWFGTQQISGNQPTQTITLKRAVAKLNLLETGKLIAGTTLTATFDQPTVFNVATGGVTSDSEARTETITTSAISGSKEVPVQLGADYFILSPASTQYVAKVTFKCGEEEAFDVDNVPFQANCATNIKGHYTSLASETFSVSCDDDWNTTDNEVDLDPDPTIWNGKYPTSEAQAKEWLGTETEGKSESNGKKHVFTITAARQLAALQYLVEKRTKMTGPTSNTQYSYATYKLATDIDLNNALWTPIGTVGTNSNTFSGGFNGQGYTIRNMNVNISNTNYAGFFGSASGDDLSIKNLIVEGTVKISTTTEMPEAGGIAGEALGGSIAFCRFNGTISSTFTGAGELVSNDAGGIVGYSTSPITSCISDATVTVSGGTTMNSAYSGGLVGNSSKPVTYSAWNSTNTTNGYNFRDGQTDAYGTNSFTSVSELNSTLLAINASAPDSEYIWQANSDPNGYPILVKQQ